MQEHIQTFSTQKRVMNRITKPDPCEKRGVGKTQCFADVRTPFVKNPLPNLPSKHAFPLYNGCY